MLALPSWDAKLQQQQQQFYITMEKTSHRNFNIEVSPQLHLQICSDFDSGNLESASLMSAEDHSSLQIPKVKLELTPAAQPFNPQYSTRQSLKSYFHFNIKASKSVCLHVFVRRMAILSIIEGSFQEYYRLCVGTKKLGQSFPDYTKIKPQDMRLAKQGDQYVLEFKYELNQNEKVYFAYHYPYSYEKICHFLQDLDQHFRHSQEHNESAGLLSGVRGVGFGESNNTYFRNELLIQSLEGRQVNLLTITEIPNWIKKNGLMNLSREPRISKSLFPYYEIEERPFKFNKPYIMVTSRVHPGETSASYALEGFVKKLLGTSAEAEFLRKTFVFLIVPAINPDGVFHGTYRMDMQGHNLNRFYNSCAAHKQPAIFAISSLLHHHAEDLVGFFDIHSHPQAKGSFAYGNAYSAIQDQTESQLFAKLLGINSESFQYEHCTFSQKNMSSKDINDILTKDGSSRVNAYKRMLAANLCNGVHCYAIQLGYHGCPIKKGPTRADEIFQFKSSYRRATKQFDVIDYLELGTDIVNTLCQVYVQTYSSFNIQSDGTIKIVEQNPTSPLQSLRQQIAKQIYEKDERFRIMDSGVLKKIKAIHNIICTNLYSKILKRFSSILENVRQFQGSKRKKEEKLSINKIKNQKQENVKIVHSMELDKQNYLEDQNKRSENNGLVEKDFKKLRDRFPQREIKNMIFKGKEKVNIIPLQFHIPQQRNISENRGVRAKEMNFNRILQMQADSLPRIQRKKINFLTERHKLKQKRIQSSINSHNPKSPAEYLGLPLSRGGLERKMLRVSANQKATIESNVDGIIEYQNIMNLDRESDDEEFQKPFKVTQQFSSNYNPEMNLEMNMVRNSQMFKRQAVSRENPRKNSQINRFTDRINAKPGNFQEKKRSKSREKLIISAQNQNQGLNTKCLPKLQSLTQKVRNKFDLELKMKQKYDKQYRLDDKFQIEGKEKIEEK